ISTRRSASTSAQATTRVSLNSGIHRLAGFEIVIPGRCAASNPESRDSGSGPSDHSGMTPNLRPVVAVDRDIFLGEVAGQHAVAALAQPERDLDLDLRRLHRLRHFRLVVGGIARALIGDADAVERD